MMGAQLQLSQMACSGVPDAAQIHALRGICWEANGKTGGFASHDTTIMRGSSAGLQWSGGAGGGGLTHHLTIQAEPTHDDWGRD